MKVLIACEYSGAVRDAFIARGHDAVSCDILPTESPGPHYEGSVLDIIDDEWDLMVGHPPCTYLCVAGLHYSKKDPIRMGKTLEAVEFFKRLYHAPIDKVCIENPVGYLSTYLESQTK